MGRIRSTICSKSVPLRETNSVGRRLVALRCTRLTCARLRRLIALGSCLFECGLGLVDNSLRVLSELCLDLGLGYGVALLWLPERRARRTLSKTRHILAGVLAPLTILGLSMIVHRPTTAGLAALSCLVIRS